MILDQEKIDFLWKRIIYGVTKTAGSLVKFASNETIASLPPILPSQIWADAADIPATPLANAAVASFTGASRVRMTTDPTSPVNQAWLATQTYGDLPSRMTDFIPPTFGTGYAVKVYIGDPNGGPAARIFPDTAGEEFVFDYAAGVLVFTGTIPANKPASIGSGSLSAATSGIFIELYRYIGSKGAGGGGTGPGNLGTMATQDADNVNITGGALDGVTLTNVTVDGGWF
ncbi:hypothetical protein BAJUN_02320 [Bajunvirus bajun]|uniref:Uncharacterized protein n=1 Tax=Brevundimonas phage vB_BgoS-Bajun TaxID=2948594 RepID=A0A9E7N7F5_9CAUD|nr:hypothetical protein BAJUN_02320 [Brevundimonas phage vB_BgoS-Bajun]